MYSQILVIAKLVEDRVWNVANACNKIEDMKNWNIGILDIKFCEMACIDNYPFVK